MTVEAVQGPVVPRLRRPSVGPLDQYWIAGLAITVHGVRLGIRANDPSLLSQLHEFLPYGWKPYGSDDPVVDRLFSIWIARDGATAAVFHDEGEQELMCDLRMALHVLEIRMKMFVAERAHRYLYVHAGAVGWRGRGIVLPGVT